MSDMGGATGTASNGNAAQADTVQQQLRRLEALTAELSEAFKEKDAGHEQLLAKYNKLKSSCAGEIPEPPSEHNCVVEPYVLVLINAHSHRFIGNYLHGTESGGVKVAAMLKQAIDEHVDSQYGEERRCIVIRAYANVKKLSIASAQAYSSKNPAFGKPKFPRCLGGFAAGFSRDDALVDFVDVAEDAALERKICDVFQRNIKNPHCQHIFFGASGSAQYTRMLGEHLEYAEKITLIQGRRKDTSLANLGLLSVTFAQVFDTFAEAQANTHDMKVPSNHSASGQPKLLTDPAPSVAGSSQSKPPKPHSDSLRTPSTLPVWSSPRGPPRAIPVNAAGHRIDPHMDAPTSKQWKDYTACKARRKLCDRFHLGPGCSYKYCTYDHDPINFNEHYCHRFEQREWPCRNGGKCRYIYCSRGHTCHYEACKKGKIAACKMPVKSHGIDLKIEDWVPPEDDGEGLDAHSSGEESRQEPEPNPSATVGDLIDLS